jgi:hypothetical protein
MLFLIIFFSACTNLQTTNTDLNDKFEKIKLGDTRQQLEQVWGPGTIDPSLSLAKEYSIIHYAGAENQDIAAFTVDPKTQKVEGKTKWIYPQDLEYKTQNLLNGIFLNITMKIYYPCERWGRDVKLLINREHGISIATTDDHVDSITWMTPQLTSDFINGYFKKCPQN